jgi:hypothetical protein
VDRKETVLGPWIGFIKGRLEESEI